MFARKEVQATMLTGSEYDVKSTMLEAKVASGRGATLQMAPIPPAQFVVVQITVCFF
jgi:hypothetical protein